MSIYNANGNAVSSAYGITSFTLETAYDVDGNVIFSGSQPEPEPLDYSSYTTTDLFTYVTDGFNGFDVYDGIIAQVKASNSLYLFGMDGSVIATNLSMTASHGDSASFSSERKYKKDEFPYLYVTSDTTPAYVYVNRITRTGSELIKSLLFPSDKTGYYSAHAYDETNQIMYMVGYSEQNFTSSDSGNNKTVVSKWDMSQLTGNGDGTYTPAFISSYERDFIYVMQGQQFFDGYIWIASGYNNGGAQYIYAMNPSDGVIEHTITLDDTIEIEGLAWVYDSTANKYWMLIGQQNGSAGINYSRIDFATLEES